MNLTQLRYFVKLAELEHYGHAARELYISQPALSNSIHGLEKELGFALFERSGRNIVLTEDGKKFNLHISNALNEIEKGINLKSEDSSGHYIIKIGAVSSIQKEFLPVLLSSYAKKVSDRSVFDIFEKRNTFKCLKALRLAQLDFGLCGFVPEETDMAWIPVLPQNLHVALNPRHPLAERRSISLCELGNYSVISYRESSVLHRTITRLARVHGFSIRCAFEDEISAITQILTTDKGAVALMLDRVESTLSDRVVFIPIEELDTPFHMVYLAYRKSLRRPQEMQQFIDYFQARAKSLGTIELLEDRYLGRN